MMMVRGASSSDGSFAESSSSTATDSYLLLHPFLLFLTLFFFPLLAVVSLPQLFLQFFTPPQLQLSSFFLTSANLSRQSYSLFSLSNPSLLFQKSSLPKNLAFHLLVSLTQLTNLSLENLSLVSLSLAVVFCFFLLFRSRSPSS